MNENVETVDFAGGPSARNTSRKASVSCRRFTALLAVLAVIAGLVFTSVQPASADAPSIAWTAQSAAEANWWNAVAYGNGTFVAVSGDGTNRVMTSTDGITWTAHAAAAASNWARVTYGNGTFVAIIGSGDTRVMTSTDNGVTWTARTDAEANGWASIAYGNGTFVAVSYDGTHRVMTSTDGITWTARSAAEANSWVSVTYGNGIFVAVAVDGTNRTMTSTDGINWTASVAAEANSWSAVTYGNGIFVAIARSGTNRVMTGVQPTTAPAAPTSLNATPSNGSVSIAFTPGATGGSAITKYQYTTDDGANWADVSSGGTSSPSSITGLTNGTSYSIKLRAYNTVGGGTASDAVSVTPCIPPDAPTSLVATPGNGSASIAFTPGATGGDTITKYQYQIGSGSWLDVSSGGTSSPVVITGLTNYVVNSVKLRAFNAAGGGTASSPVSVTPKVSAPTITSAYSGNMAGVAARGINVGFSRVISPGATIVSYRITAYAKGTNTVVSTVLVSRNDRAAFLGGLTRGTEYDIRVIGYLTLTGSPLVTRGTFESTTSTVKV